MEEKNTKEKGQIKIRENGEEENKRPSVNMYLVEDRENKAPSSI